MSTFSESVVEDAALDWLEAAGWSVLHGEVVLVERLRDTLLPKLISGELRVEDAEPIAENDE